MKRIFVIMMLACTAFFATQCKKAKVDSLPGSLSGETIDVTLRVDNNGSRTGITPTGIVTWNAGDKIYVVGAKDGLLGFVTAQNSGASAYFTGSISKGGNNQIFHYYYVGNNTFSNADYNYNVANQNGDIETITANSHLMHGESQSEIAPGTTDLGAIEMTSMIALARLNFMAGGVATNDDVTCKGAFSSATLDIKTGEFKTRTPGNITLNAVNSDYYVVLIPNADNSSQTLEFKDQHYGVIKMTKPIAANVLYSAGDGTPFVVNIEPLYVDVAPGTGLFEVSNDDGKTTKNVRFAKGNLVYYGSNYVGDPTGAVWKMHSKQWAYVWGNDNGYSSTGGTFTPGKTLIFDLFGWGTGRLEADGGGKPWNSETNSYGTSNNYLNSGDATSANFYEWGHLIPYNGAEKIWYTLTKKQWAWIIDGRETGVTIGSVTNCRYAKVKVKGIPGLLIFPNSFTWTAAMGTEPTTINAFNANWNGTDYDESQFAVIESAGAVFLPASGQRLLNGTTVNSVGNIGEYGRYWTGTGKEDTSVTDKAYYLKFDKTNCNVPGTTTDRCVGFAVRLAMDE
ncbi:MAG: hypothetical protein Q4F69_01290 [Bacteroidia bacterium]|nr:hypothetical protein [Bacteroidia bacterium]